MIKGAWIARVGDLSRPPKVAAQLLATSKRLVIIWLDIEAPGFRLQTASDLSGSWSNVAIAPVLKADGIHQEITLTNWPSPAFFRLAKP